MRILSFGHLPTWAGGRQESGLANVIYQLAKHGSEIPDNEVFLAATDYYKSIRKDGRLTILGWTKIMLMVYILTRPIKCARNFVRLIKLKRRYPYNERLTGLFLKRLFLERSLGHSMPDIVHLHGPQSIWYIDIIPDAVGIIVTFHGMLGLDKNVAQHEILYNMEHDVYHESRVRGVFFICSQLVDSFRREYGDNSKNNQTIFNSYDNDHFYYEGNHKALMVETTAHERVIKLFTVASLSDLKGQMRVLQALARIRLNEMRFEYYCIGADSQDLSCQMKAFAEEHRLHFEYLGKMNPDQIREHLLIADYMIMPSSSEGFGLTYLEAIACGVPVILPKDLPIAKEKALINERNSILLDDCSSRSITKILNCISDYEFNHQTVANSIEGFSWDEVAKQYSLAIRGLMSS